jgi:uncharacterized oxidoreductase
MLAIDPTAFVPLEEFRTRVKKFVEEVKGSKKAPGIEEIMIPGEPERRMRELRLREGIPIPDEIWGEISSMARKLSVDIEGLAR